MYGGTDPDTKTKHRVLVRMGVLDPSTPDVFHYNEVGSQAGDEDHINGIRSDIFLAG